MKCTMRATTTQWTRRIVALLRGTLRKDGMISTTVRHHPNLPSPGIGYLPHLVSYRLITYDELYESGGYPDTVRLHEDGYLANLAAFHHMHCLVNCLSDQR